MANRKVSRAVYKEIIRYCKALDKTSVDGVDNFLQRLSIHVKFPSPYTALAESALRKYPQHIISKSSSASSAAASLFRMPLPDNAQAAAKEIDFRLDMAFRALKFLNDRYKHVLHHLTDVVTASDWARILQDQHHLEEGMIAVCRISDHSADASIVYAELDGIAHEVLDILKQQMNEPRAAIIEKVEPPAPDESLSSLEKVYFTKMEQHRIDEEGSQSQLRTMVPFDPTMVGNMSHLHSIYLSRFDAQQAALAEDEKGSQPALDSVTQSVEEGGNHPKVVRPKGSTGGEWADTVIKALNTVIYERRGYRMNRQDYYDPNNFLIHKVVHSKVGNNMVLGAIYVAVAQRLGLDLRCTLQQSSLLIRGEGADGQPFFVDPSHGGSVMSSQEYKERSLSRHRLVEDRDLEACHPAELYSRVFRHLVNAYMLVGSSDQAMLWSERLSIFDSAAASLQLRLAREGAAAAPQSAPAKPTADQHREMRSEPVVQSPSVFAGSWEPII